VEVGGRKKNDRDVRTMKLSTLCTGLGPGEGSVVMTQNLKGREVISRLIQIVSQIRWLW
jgi:hypothetical protein